MSTINALYRNFIRSLSRPVRSKVQLPKLWPGRVDQSYGGPRRPSANDPLLTLAEGQQARLVNRYGRGLVR